MSDAFGSGEIWDGTDVPEGWAIARLRDVAHARLGKTPKSADYRDEGTLRVVKFRDITANGVQFTASKAAYVADDVSATRGLCELDAGDVLITASAHSGDQIGRKCAFLAELPREFQRIYFVGELLAVTSDPRVMAAQWPKLWFQSDGGFKEVQKAVFGVHLTAGRAQDISIPIPPKPEQQRIIVAVEALLHCVDSARLRLARIPAIMKRFRQQVIAAACSGALTSEWRAQHPVPERATFDVKRGPDAAFTPSCDGSAKSAESLPDNWMIVRVGDVCDCIVPNRDKPKSFTGNIPWVTLPDLGAHIYVTPQVGQPGLSAREVSEYRAKVVPAGSVVMSCVGRFGISAVLGQDSVINQQLHAFLVNDCIKAEYLAYVVRSQAQYLQSRATTTTIGYLNKRNCNSMPVPLPPPDEQDEIIRRVQALFALADRVEQQVTAAHGRADRLAQAILSRAFRGELVPTEAELAPREGREYEPASVLLERIRAERGVSNSTLRGRRSRVHR